MSQLGTARDPIKVFAVTRFVRRAGFSAANRRVGYFIELVARGTGTSMYKSKTCDTIAEAQALAFKYLARSPGLRFDPKVSS